MVIVTPRLTVEIVTKDKTNETDMMPMSPATEAHTTMTPEEVQVATTSHREDIIHPTATAPTMTAASARAVVAITHLNTIEVVAKTMATPALIDNPIVVMIMANPALDVEIDMIKNTRPARDVEPKR